MTGIPKFWIMACALVLCAEMHLGVAQEQAPAQAAPDVAGQGEDAPLGQPAAGNSDQANRQRRRIQTTTTATLKIGDKSISLLAAILKADAPDYASIEKLKEGEVLLLTRSQAIKLKTDFPLTFGDLALNTENVAKGYAGVYSIWLKKTGTGWAFVFNQKPDVWGTMYDPDANVGEVPVEHGTPEKAGEALKFVLEQQGQGGTLKISWGEHLWSAKFTVAQ